MSAWGPLLLLPAFVFLAVPAAWPAWALMWSLAFAIFVGCKWLSWARSAVRSASVGRHLAYLLAWPGLDADAFLDSSLKPSKPTIREWLFATSKLLLGVVVLFGIAPLVPEQLPYLAGWVGMVGIVMILHFGSFHLLSCGWRSMGVQARPLMDWPLSSASVSEFWGRRWNVAFRDLTHRFLFRPLTSLLGSRSALLAGFLFSGLIHDLVISIPAGGGYGGPTLFFLLQSVAMLMERSPLGRRAGLGRGWRGWAFTMLVLLVPVCLLCHPAFVLQVVVPFMQAVRAI